MFYLDEVAHFGSVRVLSYSRLPMRSGLSFVSFTFIYTKT